MKPHLIAAILLMGSGSAYAQAPTLGYTQDLSTGAVQAVQQRLQQAGVYSGAVDGVWGPDSATALQRYQQTHQLQVTGTLNQATASTLGLSPSALLGENQPATVPDWRGEQLRPSTVVALQRRLRELGYYNGAGDGVWGAGTQNALMRYQQDKGLRATGQLNQSTVQTLGMAPTVVQFR